MRHVARQMIGDWVEYHKPENADTLETLAEMIDRIYDDNMTAKARRAESPYYHCAPVSGRMTIFANVEYPRDNPPDAIRIGDDLFVSYHLG